MAKLMTYALAGALAVAFAPVAGLAADLPEPPLLETIPEPIEFGSSWYLRGDVGYKIYRKPDVRYGGTKYSDEDMKDTGLVGAGVGYKFNNWIRADVTADYEFKSKMKGRLICPVAACAQPNGSQLRSREEADVSAFTTMANLYADLGTWHGVTPYVGAGIGASYINVSGYDYTNPNGITGSVRGDKNWSFSWALMAGVGYEVTDNLTLDVGYRYLNLGDGKTKKTGGGFNGDVPVKIKHLQAHEMRVGVRYMLD